MQYTNLYKWQKSPDGTWECWEQEIPILDVSAWVNNGWTVDRPSQPPAEIEVAAARGRKSIAEAAA